MGSTPNFSVESNPAVFRCCQAWRAAYNAKLALVQEEESAQIAAGHAYINAMPPLYGTRNIRNFIACVTYGSLLGVVDDCKCSRLLYAAQVAHTTRRTRTPRAKAAASAQKSHSGAIKTAKNAVKEPPPVSEQTA